MGTSLREKVARARMIENNRKSEEALAALFKNRSLRYEEVKTALTGYILGKYMLEDHEFCTEDLIELSKISIKKAMANKTLFLDQKDCHGTTESMTKKILLITSIEKRLSFELTREEYMEIDTIADLAAIIMKKR